MYLRGFHPQPRNQQASQSLGDGFRFFRQVDDIMTPREDLFAPRSYAILTLASTRVRGTEKTTAMDEEKMRGCSIRHPKPYKLNTNPRPQTNKANP